MAKRLTQKSLDVIGPIQQEDRDNLTYKEVTFAHLVAEEGFSYADAYAQSFNPAPDTLRSSVATMASRCAARPRVRAEIERIEAKLKESAHDRDLSLATALNGPRAFDRIALDLFSEFVRPTTKTADKIKLGALLLRMRHIDGLVDGRPQEAAATDMGMGVDSDSSAHEATAQLREALRQIRKDRAISAPGTVIDIVAAKAKAEGITTIEIPERG